MPAARHATSRGDGFGALVALTTLGALVPGAGLVAAGLRRAGWALVTAFVLAGLGLAALASSGRLTELALRVATRPGALLAVAVAVPLLGLVWCVVIVVGHVRLRRDELTAGQQVLSGLLVVALVALVAVPSGVAARYAVAQRSLLLTVFDDPDPVREVELAAPDVEADDPWADTPRINVLLLGSDAGSDRIGTRVDTMIVASIDTQSGDAVLFSLPRNLEGPLFADGSVGAGLFPEGFYPGGRRCPQSDCLLNAVWAWAEANPSLFPGEEQPGLAATRDAVSGTLGLSIDYYAIVNLQGFIDLVDAMGGVRLTVERRLPIGGIDPEGNPIEPTGYILPGEQVLNGFTALWYARSRAGSDDYDRMRRQRCAIAAVVDQAEPARLARAFPRLAASAERNVQTDIRVSELDAFVELARRVQRGTLRSLPFTNDVVDTGNPDYDEIRALVQQAIEPPQPSPPPPSPSPPSAPPATGTPAEPTPSEPTPSPSETTDDPPEAVDVDAVCA